MGVLSPMLALIRHLVNDFPQNIPPVNGFPRRVNDFPQKSAAVNSEPAGYAALIDSYFLRLPAPLWRTVGITRRNVSRETPDRLLLTPRHAPSPSLGGQLEFALKWEGVQLPVLTQVFKKITPEEIRSIILAKPTGAQTRRLWFLYEWLTGRTLDLPDAGKVRAVPAIDIRQQFGLAQGVVSTRHSVVDNLPGTPAFCPIVRRTEVLDSCIAKQLHVRARDVLGRTHPDIVTRAAAFLLLSDSRSSFNIEGEQPSQDRAVRWGEAILASGTRRLGIDMLEELQRQVLSDLRFIAAGLRGRGGFVGMHDRVTRLPIPVHVSARPEDLENLMEGLIAYDERASGGMVDPVVAAAALAFGFVYIHPFEDGNGRLHRWLIHHVLGRAGYNPPHTVFPVSAVMLREIDRYKNVLESYTRPLLPLIEWHPTEDNNVHVVNDTSDYYRYFDATAHAEFLYHCVATTVEKDLPEEVAFLEAYDRFARRVQDIVDMPAHTLDLLHRFLHQNGGVLSKRARAKEFAKLEEEEIEQIERLYRESHAAQRDS